MSQTLTGQLPSFVVELARLCLWLAILSAIFVPLERLFPLHRSKIWRDGMGADLAWFFVGGLVTSLLLSFPLGLIGWAAREVLPDAVRNLFAGASFWTRAGVGLILGEIGYYWGHRLMHRAPLLWRFHAIHHSAEHIDFLVNSRVHPVDLVFGRLCAFLPIYVLGLARPSEPEGNLIPALVSLTGIVWSFFIHANVWWRFGPLEWVISTPRFHHWHHAMTPANRNYASMLPILDRIFGTSHLPKGRFPGEYGIEGAVPVAWVDQLVDPLVGPFPLPRSLIPDPRTSQKDPETPPADQSSVDNVILPT
jgi:sterol desaturase/sphingolipid hydroxylase (fatty acid hydroxylase superfamily)